MTSTLTPSPIPQRVLYHHRTQGKAVEGVHIRGVTDALRAEGVTVDIISLPGADPYATPKAMSPTKQAKPWMKAVVSLPEPLFELAEVAYNAVAGWRLSKYLNAHRDVGFIYERYSLFMVVATWLAKRRGIPIILEINDSCMVERVREVHYLSLARKLEYWTLKNASGLVFVSGLFRDRVLKAHGLLGQVPTIVSHNAANIDKFSFTPEQRNETRARLGLEGSVVCGYLGAFVPWHAIDKFVYQIAEKLKSNPHLKLLLVGDGATFSTVQQFVKDQGLEHSVILAGRVPHDQVPGLLAAMDMAILPSAGDYTSPVKLFEFMACGIAPVAPSLIPIQEVLKEDETGWMFPVGDYEAAVQMVLERSRDLPRLKAIGQAARSYIARERQWRNNILQLLQFWREVK